MEEENNELVGANEIVRVVGRSHREIINLHLYEGLPMYLQGGVWRLCKDKLKAWQECRARGEVYENETGPEQTEKTERDRKEEINKELEEMGEETLTYNCGLKKFEQALEKARS